MNPTKNLCAKIPAELHARICEEKDKAGKTMNQYITELITQYYENGGKKAMDENNRTVAFQIPEELFQQLKEYLKRNNLKQKDFILRLIRQAMDEPQTQTETEAAE